MDTSRPDPESPYLPTWLVLFIVLVLTGICMWVNLLSVGELVAALALDLVRGLWRPRSPSSTSGGGTEEDE